VGAASRRDSPMYVGAASRRDSPMYVGAASRRDSQSVGAASRRDSQPAPNPGLASATHSSIIARQIFVVITITYEPF